MSKSTYLSELDTALAKFANKKQEQGKPSKLPYSEENLKKGIIKKYAFDVYKVDNDPYESLWIRKDFEDGPYLVRASNPSFVREEKGDWSAISDYDRENVTLSYKNVPIARFSSKEFGFNSKDIMTFKSALLERAENDKEFLKDVLYEQPKSKQEALANTFPELGRFIKEGQ